MRTILVAATVALVGWSCATEKGSTGDAGTPKPAPPPLPIIYVPADPPPRLVTVHAVINNGAERVIYRGEPATIRGGAVAFGLDGSVPLTEETLSLSIAVSDGGTQSWDFERVTPPRPLLVLTSTTFDAEVEWVLDETKTARLALGSYTLRFAWAGESRALSFEVRDPPVAPTPAWQENRLEDRITLLLSQQRTQDALALANQGLSMSPTSIGLLESKALALEQAGDLAGALDAARESAHQWELQHPGQKPGPMTNHHYNRLLKDVLLKDLIP